MAKGKTGMEDHPRLSGENMARDIGPEMLQGSSPPERGKLLPVAASRAPGGIIPA